VLKTPEQNEDFHGVVRSIAGRGKKSLNLNKLEILTWDEN
jgi:hypothetical protein